MIVGSQASHLPHYFVDITHLVQLKDIKVKRNGIINIKSE